jgi:hypothetical protein
MFVLHLCIYRAKAIGGVSSLHSDQSYVICINPYYDEKWFIGLYENIKILTLPKRLTIN